MALMPPKIITPAPATPPLHSLVASAAPVTETDERWMGGLVWQPETCGVEAGVWAPCPVDVDGATVPLENKSPALSGLAFEQSYAPFVVELESVCDSVHRDVMESRARRQLEAATPRAVEEEFWYGRKNPTNFALVRSVPAQSGFDGDADGSGILNPTYATGGSTVTAVTADAALELLTAGLSLCRPGSRGMIHAQAWLVERWARQGWLDKDGPRLVTRSRGDIVVAYSSAVGTGPSDAPGVTGTSDFTSTWAYATSMVQLRLADIDVYAGGNEAVDRRTNRVHYRVERMAAATNDPCCAGAVRVAGLGV